MKVQDPTPPSPEKSAPRRGRPRLTGPETCTYCGHDGPDVKHRVCSECHKVVSIVQSWKNRSKEELRAEIDRQQAIIEVKKAILAGKHPLTGKPLSRKDPV